MARLAPTVPSRWTIFWSAFASPACYYPAARFDECSPRTHRSLGRGVRRRLRWWQRGGDLSVVQGGCRPDRSEQQPVRHNGYTRAHERLIVGHRRLFPGGQRHRGQCDQLHSAHRGLPDTLPPKSLNRGMNRGTHT